MSCKDCKWAEWQRTPNGRIRTQFAGKCAAPAVVAPVLPLATVNKEDVENRLNWRGGIWADNNAACPCFESAAAHLAEQPPEA